MVCAQFHNVSLSADRTLIWIESEHKMKWYFVLAIVASLYLAVQAQYAPWGEWTIQVLHYDKNGKRRKFRCCVKANKDDLLLVQCAVTSRTVMNAAKMITRSIARVAWPATVEVTMSRNVFVSRNLITDLSTLKYICHWTFENYVTC